MKAEILVEGKTSDDGYMINLMPESAKEAKLLSLMFEKFAFHPRGHLSASHHESTDGAETKFLRIKLEYTK